MKIDDLRVLWPIALGVIQRRSLEYVRIGRITQQRPRRIVRNRRELREELRPSLAHVLAELTGVIREEQERRGRPELLSLKQQRRAWHQQQEGGHRAIAAGAGPQAQACAARGVRHLIVILDERDELRRPAVERGLPACLLLPRVELPLIEESPFGAREKLLR
jgi:hypothetical protein